jgi:hypothetical protein
VNGTAENGKGIIQRKKYYLKNIDLRVNVTKQSMAIPEKYFFFATSSIVSDLKKNLC